MKTFLCFILCMIASAWILSNCAKKEITRLENIPPVIEEECWANGGDWEFVDSMDSYGIDNSHFECIGARDE